MKKGTIILMVLLGINLIILGGIFAIAQQNGRTNIFTTSMYVPIPQRYIPTLLNESYITNIEVVGTETRITVDLTGMTEEEINEKERQLKKIETHFLNLYNSDLTGTPLQNELIPFACAKDTGNTRARTGIYITDNRFVVDVGDTRGRCP